ncbi:MAG: glycoside hydrolase family 3 protein [bacterium]|nr:glycoside hydrolase family 3 protein [bacterium]
MMGFKGTELPEETRQFIETHNIGFVVLFYRNIESVPQVAELTGAIHSSAAVPPFIYTDQEGGTVVQFKELAATVVSPMGLTAGGDPAIARKAGLIIGREMKAVGVDGVLAPTLDVNFEEKNPIIGIRSFSDEPETVVTYAKEFAAGLNEGGVAACGKHYPGHGGTTKDSHREIPDVPVSPEYFYHYCYNPFLAAASGGIDAIMSSHVRFPVLSPHIATFCPFLIDRLLRRKAKYNGVVISDCLEMKAVKDNYSPEEIVRQSIGAGLDVLIASHTTAFQKELVDALYFYVKKGIIPEKRIDQSLERILKLKEKYSSPAPSPTETRTTVSAARPHRREEEEIADRSITLLRNRKGVLPIKPASKTLIVEWGKVQATLPVSSAESRSYLAPAAEQFLGRVDVEILPYRQKLPDEFKERLETYDNIIAGLYSRSPAVEALQAESLLEILEIRDDVIAAALGNPYDIRNFPAIAAYVVTYGFRRVQVEALFKLVTGKIQPFGRLPVQISHIFPRGSGLDTFQTGDPEDNE